MANASKKQSQQQPLRPAQQQSRPGDQSAMRPEPVVVGADYRPAGKLRGLKALISGGDSGIGRSVAVGFALEGADVAFCYLSEDDDARETVGRVEDAGGGAGGKCFAVRGDIGDRSFCRDLVDQVVARFGAVDIVVNNAAEQHPQESLGDIDEQQLERTFRTNVFGMFHLTTAALPQLKRSRGASVINTTSVTAYRGSPKLLDYAATKGAIVAFTRSLSQQVVKDGIRVNAVAPGPIWTPLIPSTFPPEKVEQFGSDTPMGRAGQPAELIGAYVYLASADSSYVTGQVLHVNGGEIVNS